MRHLFALSLVLMGCGDNLGGDGAGTEDLGDLGGAVEDNGVVGKLVPQVCAARSWSEVETASKDVDLTVVPTANGAAVLHVPREGGLLSGFLLDGRGLIIGDPAGTQIMEGKWTDVSASVSDGRLVVGRCAWVLRGAGRGTPRRRRDTPYRSLGGLVGARGGEPPSPGLSLWRRCRATRPGNSAGAISPASPRASDFAPGG